MTHKTKHPIKEAKELKTDGFVWVCVELWAFLTSVWCLKWNHLRVKATPHSPEQNISTAWCFQVWWLLFSQELVCGFIVCLCRWACAVRALHQRRYVTLTSAGSGGGVAVWAARCVFMSLFARLLPSQLAQSGCTTRLNVTQPQKLWNKSSKVSAESGKSHQCLKNIVENPKFQTETT